MSCLKINIGGKLEKSLGSYFKNIDKGSKIYQAAVSNSMLGEASFENWLFSKDDFETYSNGEPTLDTFLKWTEYLDYYDKISKVFTTYDFQTTPVEFLQVANGTAIKLLDRLFEQGLSPAALFEPEVSKVNIDNIINNAIEDVLFDMQYEYEEYENDDPDFQRIPDITRAISENKYRFKKTFLNHLKTTLGIDLNVQDLENDALEDDVNVQKDRSFNKSSNEYSAVDNAPNSIKLLVYSLKDPAYTEPNVLGLPRTVDYNKTFNYIQSQLASIPGDINLQIAKLKELSAKSPELVELIDRLNFGKQEYFPASDPITYFREQKLRTEFSNQFNQSKLQYLLHLKRDDGSISIINSNLDRVENIIMSEWESTFQEIQLSNPNVINDIKVARQKGEEWLPYLGINTTAKVPTKVKDAIYNFAIKNSKDISGIYDSVKNAGVSGQIGEIARLEANTNSNTTTNQHFNAENKLIYGITLNTYLSSLVKDLAYYKGNKAKLVELYPEIFETNSVWAESILKGEEIELGVYDGFKTETNNKSKSSKDLQATDINIQRITGMLMEGKYPFIRSADRGTENMFGFKGKTKKKGLIVNSRIEAEAYLLRHLEDEMNAMFNTKEVAFYEKNNKKLRAFYITNKQGEKESLFEYLNPKIKRLRKEGKNVDDLVEAEILRYIDSPDPRIDTFIKTMVSQIVEEEGQYLEDNGVFANKNGKYKYLDEVVKFYGNPELVKELFALNSFIANIEISKVFVGDLAAYKSASDVFKRMSMLNSTKMPARVDNEMNTFINSLTHNQTGKTKVTSKINTVTVKDVVSTAKDISESFEKLIHDLFGKNSEYVKIYNDINEGDGFAYMTYDEYRIAGNRFNEWTETDEKLYQQLTSGELSTKEMYSKAKDLLRAATPKKYQYAGKVGINGTQEMAGRKFSIIPLIPGLAPKGTVLDKMLDDMIENKKDMVFFESASKFGFSSKAQNIYDDKGNYTLDLSSAVNEELDYKYMGNQLKIHNKSKDRITASTQKRKILMSNFFRNGISVDKDIAPLIDRYIELQGQIADRNYDSLSKQLKKQDTGEIDIDNLINMLILTGIEQGYSTNELSPLHFVKELKVLDGLPNKSRIESLIMAKLKNLVIKSKRSGDALAQVPDIGFEINEKMASHAERHNLQSYRMSKDGKQLLPMEIMVALPKELIGYVRDVYGDGKYTQKALDEFNAAIAVKQEQFEETGVIDKNDSLSKILTYVGFRIPNQDVSSSDVTRVKRFLPPYVSNAIVVPKSIVAKTGSDFDIDKMFLYKPNYKMLYVNKDKIVNSMMKNMVPIKRLKAELRHYNVEFSENESIWNLNKLYVDEILLSNIEIEDNITKGVRDVLKGTLEMQGIVEGFQYVTDDSDKGLENELLETEINITLHKANEMQLLRPLADVAIKKIVKEIRDLRGQGAVEDHISDVYRNSKNVDKFIAFLSGKAGVGQVAVHRTNHVLTQKAGLKMVALHDYFGIGVPLTTTIPSISTSKTLKTLSEMIGTKKLTDLNINNENDLLNKSEDELGAIIKKLCK